MRSNRLVVSAPTLASLEEYVQTRLCEHHRWEVVQTVVRRHLIRRTSQVCGLLIQLEGPRAHKSHAIWAGEENRVIFYDTAGQRFAEVQLSDAPDPTTLEKK
jgi:hypothetical protein